MDKTKAITYIESSFLSPLFKDSNITDISYNGEGIYYLSNIKGRSKSDIVITHGVAKDFIRQIANFTERQFSFTNPTLDISVGKYRIHAEHQSIGRYKEEETVTFVIRIASEKIRISPHSDFLTPEISSLIQVLISNRLSIVIGGLPSTGKTEFQKYLLFQFPKYERVIVVDNVSELDYTRNDEIDLTYWKSDEDNENASNKKLIRSALRSNPDWLILAEARGKEMVDVLQSAMTGLPLITTLHALDAEAMPFRMARMVMQSEEKNLYQEVLTDIYYHFHFYFYLSRKEKNGLVRRQISEIIFIDNNGKQYPIFYRTKDKPMYKKLPKEALKILDIEQADNLFKQTFLEDK